MNAQLEKAAKTETKRSEELGSKLETANKRIQRMGEILANSMDELISERKNLRELKARMETSLQSEKAERQVEDLKAAAASRLPVPVSPVKHDQGYSKTSVKNEHEWDV
jgi:TolA-binding protein